MAPGTRHPAQRTGRGACCRVQVVLPSPHARGRGPAKWVASGMRGFAGSYSGLQLPYLLLIRTRCEITKTRNSPQSAIDKYTEIDAADQRWIVLRTKFPGEVDAVRTTMGRVRSLESDVDPRASGSRRQLSGLQTSVPVAISVVVVPTIDARSYCVGQIVRTKLWHTRTIKRPPATIAKSQRREFMHRSASCFIGPTGPRRRTRSPSRTI